MCLNNSGRSIIMNVMMLYNSESIFSNILSGYSSKYYYSRFDRTAARSDAEIEFSSFVNLMSLKKSHKYAPLKIDSQISTYF